MSHRGEKRAVIWYHYLRIRTPQMPPTSPQRPWDGGRGILGEAAHFSQLPQLISRRPGPKSRVSASESGTPAPACQLACSRADYIGDPNQSERLRLTDPTLWCLWGHNSVLHLVSVFGDNHFIKVNLLWVRASWGWSLHVSPNVEFRGKATFLPSDLAAWDLTVFRWNQVCMCPCPNFLGPRQLEIQSCFPNARRSVRRGSHPAVTITGQTPRWLGEMPKHHLRKTNQHCANDCSRKLEGKTNSFFGQRPLRRAQEKLA